MPATDSLCDIAGLRVGHHTLAGRATGCSVVLCEAGAVAGVDVRGAAPGTRETDLLSPLNTVQQVHAVLLSGGSAFGLGAASGVMRWLEARQVGLQVGRVRVPIVPAAILFDLWQGDLGIRPDAAAGYAACEAASARAGTEAPAQGSVGAGAGASVGKLFGIERAMKGGIGSASLQVGGITVAALVAVNALGDVIEPGSGRIVAGARGDDGLPFGQTAAILRGELPAPLAVGMATTIGVVATDALLDKAGASALARVAHDGLARVIAPVHTRADGDTLFALATGGSGLPGHATVLGVMAAEVVARAVLNAVRHATGLPGWPSASGR